MRCQQVVELIMNEKKLANIKKTELCKILYSNNVTDDVIEMILTTRKKAMCRRKLCPRTGTNILKKLTEKENLKIEKQILEAEINIYKVILMTEKLTLYA